MMKKTKKFIGIGFLGIIFIGLILLLIGIFAGNNEDESIPKYEVYNSDLSESKSKTFVTLDVGVKSEINEKGLNILLYHLYDSIMNTSGYKYHKKPNSTRIFVFPSKYHYESQMGQWIGKISKAKNNNSPEIEIQLNNLNVNQSNKNYEIIKNIEETKQKEIWHKVIKAEDKARNEAEKKYPITITANSIDEIENQRKRARQNMEKNHEYEEELNMKYRKDIEKEYNVTDTILKTISTKALNKNWPFPKYE